MVTIARRKAPNIITARKQEEAPKSPRKRRQRLLASILVFFAILLDVRKALTKLYALLPDDSYSPSDAFIDLSSNNSFATREAVAEERSPSNTTETIASRSKEAPSPRNDHHGTTTTERPSLPQFQEGKGGLVIFYHVAKTGGSTIRGLFHQLDSKVSNHFKNVRYMNPLNSNFRAPDVNVDGGTCIPHGHQKWEKSYRNTLKHITSEDHNVTLLLEIHGGCPGLEIMAPYIQNLRKTSQEHNKPFFAFTLVRDPLPYLISYFKFFHGQRCTWRWCEHGRYANFTEENLLASAQVHPNQQCFLLKHLSAIEGMHPSFYDKCRVGADDCNNLYSSMKSTLDWIGTTERLSVDTLPLLHQMLGLRNKSGNTTIVAENKTVSSREPFEQHLSNSTIAKLSQISSLDQVIYDQVTSDYRLADRFPGIIVG